jgi:C4-dicarboxylate transporter, DctM subunit
MSPEIIGLLGLAVLLVLLAFGTWIGMAMAIVGIAGVMIIRSVPQALTMAGSIPYQNISFYTISVIPVFILMGMVIANTGMGNDLFNAFNKIVGQVRGGLAMAVVVSCAALGAITGSAQTGIIVMSQIGLKEMRKFKYSDVLSTGAIAASSTMGILIPPSLPMVLYGVLTEQSIGKLFIAGILPGLLQATVYMILIYIWMRIHPDIGPAGPKTTIKEKATALKDTWPVLALFLLVMGGIYGGIFTATEAGAVGAAGAIIIAVIKRQATRQNLLSSFVETGKFCGMVILMIVGMFLFIHFIAVSKLPMVVGDFVSGLGLSPILIIAAIIVMYLILGCFLPELPMIMLTIPIIYPLTQLLGFDPIWFGIIVVKVMEVGSLTPPVGMNVFMLSGVSGVSVGTIYRGVIPFILSDFIQIIILVAFPIISLALPNLMS